MKYFVLIVVLGVGIILGRLTGSRDNHVTETESSEAETLRAEVVRLKEELKKQLATPTRIPAPAMSPETNARNSQGTEPPAPAISEQSAPARPAARKNWVQAEKTIPNIHNQSDVSAFLQAG